MMDRLLIVVLTFAVCLLAARTWSLSERVTTLEHACVPVATGGGVTQCAQPNSLQTASSAK